MKPSLLRLESLKKGISPLRVRSQLNSSQEVFYTIVIYTGSGWVRWFYTDFYETAEQAEAEIVKAVAIQPERYINDKVFQPE